MGMPRGRGRLQENQVATVVTWSDAARPGCSRPSRPTYLGGVSSSSKNGLTARALVTADRAPRFSPRSPPPVGARVPRSASALPRLFWVVAQSPGTAPPCLQTLLELRVCKPPGIGATLKSGFKVEIPGDMPNFERWGVLPDVK